MATEQYTLAWQKSFGMRTLAFRFFNVYGPRQAPGHAYAAVVPAFAYAALRGEPLTIAGDGSQYRKFIYVTDIAKAHLLAMGDGAANQTYNLEGIQKVTVLEVAERIRDLVGEHVKIERTPARPGDFAGREVSNDKAERELGWKPETHFDVGLKATAEWFFQKWGSPQAHRAL